VSDRLLELEVRILNLASRLAARARSEHGQATVEWIALMVGFAALVTLLAGKDVWQRAAEEIVDTVDAILHKSATQERV